MELELPYGRAPIRLAGDAGVPEHLACSGAAGAACRRDARRRRTRGADRVPATCRARPRWRPRRPSSSAMRRGDEPRAALRRGTPRELAGHALDDRDRNRDTRPVQRSTRSAFRPSSCAARRSSTTTVTPTAISSSSGHLPRHACSRSSLRRRDRSRRRDRLHSPALLRRVRRGHRKRSSRAWARRRRSASTIGSRPSLAARAGIVDGNPCRDDLDEAVRLVRRRRSC